MPMSRSSALSVNVMVMFEMHDLNGALFLNAIFFWALSSPFTAVAKSSIVTFTIIYASL